MKRLSDCTLARVELGSAGDSLPTRPLLDFRLAHARARDAVHFPLDGISLMQEMAERNWPARVIRSAARDRHEYILRPDKGRILDENSTAELAKMGGTRAIIFLVADGLSALAVHRHAIPLLEEVLRGPAGRACEANPIWIVQQGRVAIGDCAGALLGADLSVVIIGERPGLSTPDSLGVYLTWQPRPGRTDSERNCISNIHAQGLSYAAAANKLRYLIDESRARQLSGTGLKEASRNLLTQA